MIGAHVTLAHRGTEVHTVKEVFSDGYVMTECWRAGQPVVQADAAQVTCPQCVQAVARLRQEAR